MGDDLMGATSSTPQWSKINNSSSVYNRTLYYLAGNNKILSVGMKCRIKKLNKQNIIEIWNVNFSHNTKRHVVLTKKIKV